MSIYIALLRGINVGGKNLLPMKELTAILEDLGAQRVKTYIQSGNAVFVSSPANASSLATRISREIKKRRGFEPQVLLLEVQELLKAMKQNPFSEPSIDPASLHVSFLVSAPTKPDLEALASLKTASERFELIDQVFYLHAPAGVGRSKVAAKVARLLGVSMTDRNWRTVCKIRQMVEDLS